MHKANAAVLILFLLHLAAALYVAYERPALFLQNDGEEYYELGKNLGEQGEFVIRERRYYEPRRTSVIPEGYRIQIQSVMMGALTAAKIPAPVSAALLLAAAAAVSAYFMFRIAVHLSGSHLSGWIAMILFQFHPLLALYSVQFGSEALFTAALLWYTYHLMRGEYCRSAAAGAVAALIRPTALVFLPAGICLILLLRKRIRPAALYALIFFALLLPAGIRSYVVLGDFSLTGYLGGYNLFVGNNRHNLEAYRHAGNGYAFLHHQNLGWQEAMRLTDEMPVGTSPAEGDRIMRDHALNELKSMSLRDYLILFGGKTWHFLRPYPLPDIHGAGLFWFMTILEVLLFAAGIAGAFCVRNRADLLCAGTVAGAGLLAHTLVHVYMRHRVPFLIPLLILFAAVFFAAKCFACFPAVKKHPEILPRDPE